MNDRSKAAKKAWATRQSATYRAKKTALQSQKALAEWARLEMVGKCSSWMQRVEIHARGLSMHFWYVSAGKNQFYKLG